MCIVAIFVIGDIAEADHVQLLQASTPSSVDREQDWECDETAKEAESDGDLQISEEEEAIERMMVENKAIGGLVERADPIEEAIW